MNRSLRLPKAFDEVTEATLIDEDWYTLRLYKQPVILPNGALKAYMKENNLSASGSPEAIEDALYAAADQAGGEIVVLEDGREQACGLNWVLNLKIVHEDQMINGRMFKAYLPVPCRGDADRVTPMGQTVEDSKMEKIMKYLEAFKGGAIDGTAQSAELSQGDMAQFYIVQRFNERMERDENTIDINNDPMPV